MDNKKNKKYKKAKLVFICITTIAFILIYNSTNSRQDKIVRLVNKNHEFLYECVDDKSYDKIYEIKAIKKITPYSVGDNELYIDFYCYGTGLVSSSVYYGFYYSSNNEPIGFQAARVELEQSGNGRSWQEFNGDNRYYTEKITDYWYYYEAGF